VYCNRLSVNLVFRLSFYRREELVGEYCTLPWTLTNNSNNPDYSLKINREAFNGSVFSHSNNKSKENNKNAKKKEEVKRGRSTEKVHLKVFEVRDGQLISLDGNGLNTDKGEILFQPVIRKTALEVNREKRRVPWIRSDKIRVNAMGQISYCPTAQEEEDVRYESQKRKKQKAVLIRLDNSPKRNNSNTLNNSHSRGSTKRKYSDIKDDEESEVEEAQEDEEEDEEDEQFPRANYHSNQQPIQMQQSQHGNNPNLDYVTNLCIMRIDALEKGHQEKERIMHVEMGKVLADNEALKLEVQRLRQMLQPTTLMMVLDKDPTLTLPTRWQVPITMSPTEFTPAESPY